MARRALLAVEAGVKDRERGAGLEKRESEIEFTFPRLASYQSRYNKAMSTCTRVRESWRAARRPCWWWTRA